MREEQPAMDDDLPLRRAVPKVGIDHAWRSCFLDSHVDAMLPLRVSEALPELTGRQKGLVWLYRAGTLLIRSPLRLGATLIGVIGMVSNYSYIGLYLLIFGGTLDPTKPERWKHITLGLGIGFILGIIMTEFDINRFYIYIIIIIPIISGRLTVWAMKRGRKRRLNSRLDNLTGYASS